VQWFAERGHAVWGVDRNISGAQHLSQCATLVQADLEAGGWPLMEGSAYRKFGAVVVTNYLWRALLPAIGRSLEPGGVLLYETFARGNEVMGRPSRAEFLLESGELLRSFAGLHIVAYENGVLAQPARCVQRLAGIFAPGTAGDPAHAPLHALSLE
jgi:SAM-dependent methyltransferase